MEICKRDKCTACYACVNACLHGAIRMKEDIFGELHPVVDETKCKQCQLCKKVCPNNVELEFNYPMHCYASWITDKAKRRICASGGIGTIMAEYVILKLHGVVFGSRYDKNLCPIMTFTEQIEDLEFFKGSRYVQSIVGEDTYIKVKEFLSCGRMVLFIGTPCQIAGLKTFLRKEYTNLITVDLICHGVCPTKYFKEEIQYVCKTNNLRDIKDIRFRGNDGKNFYLSIWTGRRDGKTLKCIYNKPADLQYYFAGFLLGVSMRENCYSCGYAKPVRVSDITIGDFIGLGKRKLFPYSKNNVSSVTTNSNKGYMFYMQMSEATSSLFNVERDYKERLDYKPSLLHPFDRHPLNEKFKRLYIDIGYVYAIRNTLKYIVRKNKIKRILNFWTYIYRIPRKIYRIITEKKVVNE